LGVPTSPGKDWGDAAKEHKILRKKRRFPGEEAQTKNSDPFRTLGLRAVRKKNEEGTWARKLCKGKNGSARIGGGGWHLGAKTLKDQAVGGLLTLHVADT